MISFVFDVGGQPLEYRPGQYLHYELDTLAFPDERGNRRHFTISSSPTEKGILMFTTKMRGSGFKETMRQAPLGYQMTCETPVGEFVMGKNETDRRHVFIAAGIGITPYRSILRYAADVNERINGVLLYFNRSPADIIFRRELEDIARTMPTFSVVHMLSQPETGWEGERGRLDEALLRKRVTDLDQSLFWSSGPPAMVIACRELLLQIGVKEEAIRMDKFLGY